MVASPPLVAFWSFASAWMLLWGLAAAAPFLIHLWSRRRYRQTDWAAMEFLLAAVRRNARRMALEQWLLLLLRMLVLTCFAIAVAQPLFSWSGGISAPRQRSPALTLIILDASLSMDYRAEGRSRFESAQEAARNLVRQGNPGDGYLLLLLADRPEPVIRQPAFDSANVLDELASLRVTQGGGDLRATLEAAQALLEDAARRHPEFGSRRIVFLTDLERTTWEDVALGATRERVGRLSELAALSVVNLGNEETSNLALTRLESSRPLTMPGQAVELRAEVQNFSSRPVGRLPVELLLDGERIFEEVVELAAGGRTSVTCTHVFEGGGEHILQARIHDPRLPADNTRWLAVPVREALRVLCLEGRPRDAHYLALALAPEKASRRTLVTERPDNTLLDEDLSAFDAVCLCNVPRFTAEEALALKNYVAQGGSLLIFLGDQIQADDYNRLLAEPASTEGTSVPLLPARLSNIVSGAQFTFDPLEYRHPILKAFRGHERSGLLTTPIWTYYRLAPNSGSGVALALDNGDPALVAGKFGQGRMLLFASAVSPLSVDRSRVPPLPWNALDSWPSFPPLAQEMLEYAVCAQVAGRNVRVGEELAGPMADAEVDGIVITTPEGKSEPANQFHTGNERGWSFPAEWAGPYRVATANNKQSETIYAANVDIRESELASFDAEQLPVQFGREIRDNSAQFAVGLSPPRPWFRFFLAAVMALLAAESLVAWNLRR